MEPGLPTEEVRKLAKEVVQRVGSRGAQGDFCRALCCRLAPGLLLPEQLQVCLADIPHSQCSRQAIVSWPSVLGKFPTRHRVKHVIVRYLFSS